MATLSDGLLGTGTLGDADVPTLGTGTLGSGTLGDPTPVQGTPRPVLLWLHAEEVRLRLDVLEPRITVGVLDQTLVETDAGEQMIVVVSEVESI